MGLTIENLIECQKRLEAEFITPQEKLLTEHVKLAEQARKRVEAEMAKVFMNQSFGINREEDSPLNIPTGLDAIIANVISKLEVK